MHGSSFHRCLLLLVTIFAAASSGQQADLKQELTFPGEKHLHNIRQLTFGGQNAEAYFSADDRYLIFQHQGSDVPCDQIYIIPVDTPDEKPAQSKLASTG